MEYPVAETIFDIDIFRNNNCTIMGRVTNRNDVAFAITGATIVFTAKNDYNDTTAVISKSTAVGTQVAITNAALGYFEVYIVPSDTSSLTEETMLVFDIRITLTTGEKYTVACGNLKVKLDVTGGT